MRRDSSPRSGGLQTAEAIRKSPFLEELLFFLVLYQRLPDLLVRSSCCFHRMTFAESQLADETTTRTDLLGSRLSSHLVAKRHRAALVCFDLRQMQGDVSTKVIEEWDPITNQDR